MAPLEIRHRSVRPISAKHAQASRFLQQCPLNCLISRAKGYDTTEADFLTWSKSNQQKKFDYVVMNPPFADNRARLHLQAAASHLAAGGSLAAVLPLSLQGLDNLLGEEFRTEWMDVFENEFENTTVSVRILYAERIQQEEVL
ncbi:methyltransferase [Escherichia coli]|uniref:methyltransferase n=1 Tax=Escherichia coli TaxID=562 RepID=UPI00207B1BCE|nr:methyltransferase [Escherichia coli]